MKSRACLVQVLLIGAVFFGSAAVSAAPVAPINPDRPSQSTGTAAVGPGVLQIESGAVVQTFKGGGPGQFSLPVELRVGLGDTTEIGITNALFNSQGSEQGVGDTTVDVKWQCGQVSTANGPAYFAVIPSVTMLTGAPAFRNAGAIPELLLCADVPAGKSGQLWNFDVAASSLKDPGNGRRFGQFFGVATYNFNLTPEVGAFVESAVYGPDQSVRGEFIPSVDGGMSFLLDLDTQVDFAVLKGLGSRGTDWFFTVGLSQRFR